MWYEKNISEVEDVDIESDVKKFWDIDVDIWLLVCQLVSGSF